jgi:pimeloyl-ACP methyl ester carboxylesterase
MTRTRLPILLAAAALLGLAPAPAVVIRAPDAAQAPHDVFEQPARLVRLPDGRRLNFVCMGQGAPTVLLESGYGVGAYAWAKVEPRIAAVTRVCAYDRAGYAFSDPGPMPRDGEAIARDLDRGLRAARVSGPFVLVGHSAGGLYARLFAARRRGDVVGIVFVDSSVEHQLARLDARFGEGAGTLEPVRRRPARCLAAATAPASSPAAGERESCQTGLGPGPAGQGLRPATWKTRISELDTLFGQTSDEVDRAGGLLADVPAIVLSAGKADGEAASAADDPGMAAWHRMHGDLARGFRHGEQRFVKSGHLMMNDRPEVVAAAAIELVEQARKR